MRRKAIVQKEFDELCRRMRAAIKRPQCEAMISYKYALGIIKFLKKQIRPAEREGGK